MKDFDFLKYKYHYNPITDYANTLHNTIVVQTLLIAYL